MKKWNRRTRVVVLSVVLALLFLAIYIAGVMLPEELTAPSIRSTRLPPSRDHFFVFYSGNSVRDVLHTSGVLDKFSAAFHLLRHIGQGPEISQTANHNDCSVCCSIIYQPSVHNRG